MAYVSKRKQLYFSVFFVTALFVAGIALFVTYIMPKYSTVTFKDLGVDVEIEAETVQVEKGEAMPKLPVPIKYGYVFNGWYYSREFNENQKVHELVDIVDFDVSLYPNFTPASFKITFNNNNGGGTGVVWEDQVFDTNFMFPTDTQAGVSGLDGKVLSGWSTNEDGTGTIYQPGDIAKVSGEDVTFYAVWDNPKTTIHFVVGDGVEYKPNYTDYVGELVPKDILEKPASGKTGHTFAGWYFNEQFTGICLPEKAENFEIPMTSNGSFTLYAKWEPIVYTIKFYIGEDVYTIGGAEQIAQIPFGQKLTTDKLPIEPNVVGKMFVAWCVDETCLSVYNFETLITQPLKLYAKFGDIPDVDNATNAEAFVTELNQHNEIVITGINSQFTSSLTSLIIPRQINGKNIVEITDGVANLTQLVEVSLPHTIRTIDPYAFTNCTKLAEFKLQSESNYFAVEDGVLYTKNFEKLVRYPAAKAGFSFVTKTATTTIGSYAFGGVNKLEELTISAGTIEANAFEYCTTITKITLLSGVTSVDDSAFNNYYAMAEVVSSSAHIVVENGAIYNSDKTTLIKFFDKNANVNFVAPSTVTTVLANAFRNANNLISITLGENCVNVARNAIRGCANLTTVTLKGVATDATKVDGDFISSDCSAIQTIFLDMSSANQFYAKLSLNNNFADKLQQLPLVEG